MATIIPFQQLIERRARQQARGVHEECVRILRCNCAFARQMCEVAVGFEQDVWRRRVAVLDGLLRYAERWL
ncbi:MAG: hypothetical protein N3C12_08630 [Candidatus Binatia bacterium]|nr:hypothetical protein [Candidatus Binatia bacterium]